MAESPLESHKMALALCGRACMSCTALHAGRMKLQEAAQAVMQRSEVALLNFHWLFPWLETRQPIGVQFQGLAPPKP